MNKQIEDYLNKATEGLRDDAELQLDARAELAAHAEEKYEELLSENCSKEEAAEQTVKALGDPLEIATDLFDANRQRMNLRAQIRWVMRFALVPLAILSTIWAFDFVKLFTLNFIHAPDRIPEFIAPVKLSYQEKLILSGDLSRPSVIAQQKAIWESEPTNRIYFANYFSHVAQKCSTGSEPIPENLLKQAQTLDPDNALYVYLEAYQLLSPPNTNLTALSIIKNPGTSKYDSGRPEYEIIDRERLDQSMALFQRALSMPYCKSYSAEMSQLRLGLIPAANSFAEQIALIGYNAESYQVPFSFVSVRSSVFTLTTYGDLLLQEDDVERAAVFLNAWKPLSRHLVQSSEALIEAMMASAVVRLGYGASAIYQDHGFSDKAELMLTQVGIASVPNEKYQQLREESSDQELTQNYGSLLANLSIPSAPNSGNPLTAEDFEPTRRLELTVITRALIFVIGLIMLVFIAGSFLLGLILRFSSKANLIPILLMPNLSAFIRLISFSILLPGTFFLLATRLAPWSGHEFNIFIALHKVVAEFSLLGFSLLFLPAMLGCRLIQKRCLELDIPTIVRKNYISRFIFFSGCAVLIFVWILPVNSPSWITLLSTGATGILMLTLLVKVLDVIIHSCRTDTSYALYYRTLLRSLTPLYAAALIMLNLISRPILSTSEERYIHQDKLFNVNEGGVTSIETRTSNHIRDQLLEALDTIEEMD